MEERNTIFVGVDVHKSSASVCAVSADGRDEKGWQIPNEPKAVRRLFKRLASKGPLRVCYEAGPCGYALRRQLEEMKISCEVVAPSLIPRRPGDRVKTDRRDARKLARLYRAGELTIIHVPTEAQEAVRDLLRCRERLVEDVNRHRHRLGKFLLRHGRVWREKNWTKAHWAWLAAQRFEDPAAQRVMEEYVAQLDAALARLKVLTAEVEAVAEREPWASVIAPLLCVRGFKKITALTIVVEVVDFHRFESPRPLMSYFGLTPSLYASGGRESRGSITKAGNAHVRRVLIEAAWHARHRPQLSAALRERCEGQPEFVQKVARESQQRLNRVYRRLVGRGKPKGVAIVAVARELVGFVWALMVKAPAATSGGKPTTTAA